MPKWISYLINVFKKRPNVQQANNTVVGVLKYGHFKISNSKKKYFLVLREECLEYYKYEKHWRNNALPKRIIELKSCVNIAKYEDDHTKISSICLYTKEKSFYIEFDNNTEREEWLGFMINSQRNINDSSHDVSLKEPFDYVCQISIMKKYLGLNEKLTGMTGLRICDTKISIISYPFTSKEQHSIDIMVSSITDVGVEDTTFYIFLNKDSPLGHGELWMETYDTKISLKLLDIVREAFNNRNHDLFQELIPEKNLPVQSPTSELNFGRDGLLKEPFDYVCKISIMKKALGINEKLTGMTGLHICDTKISIINYPFKSKEQQSIDIMMPSILGVGVEGTIFYIFLRKDSPLGYGQLWMETYDTTISVKLYNIIHETFENKKQDLRPQIREPVTSPTSDQVYVDMPGPLKTPVQSDIKFNIVLLKLKKTAIRYCFLIQRVIIRKLRDLTMSRGIDHSTIDPAYTELKSALDLLLEYRIVLNDLK